MNTNSEISIQIQQDMKHWPFKVTSDSNNKPIITVEYKGEEKQLKPEEISAMILTKMKLVAENYLGKWELKNKPNDFF
mgnify:CR=1 FL=1